MVCTGDRTSFTPSFHMVDLSIDIDGISSTVATIEELEQDVATTAEWEIRVGAPYGVYLERGTRHHPPYPFFEPAIRQFKTAPRSFVIKNMGVDIDTFDDTARVVRLIAQALKVQMRANVAAQTIGGRSPGTHPEHPRIQTGQLINSIKARPR